MPEDFHLQSMQPQVLASFDKELSESGRRLRFCAGGVGVADAPGRLQLRVRRPTLEL